MFTNEHERRIPVGSTSNFRDLGGYATADHAHTTRWNRLYRSDHLAKISNTGDNVRLLFDTLHVRCAIDFRGAPERNSDPYSFYNIKSVSIPIEPGNVMTILEETDCITEELAVSVMVELYGRFVNDFKPEYTKFFRTLLAECQSGNAVVFHCTAGKDRTGYGAALLLLTLGVPRETVMEDYLLTNQFFRPPPVSAMQSRHHGKKVDEGAVNALFFVRPEYLNKSIDTILGRHPDVPSYVKAELGLSDDDIAQLKRAYLE